MTAEIIVADLGVRFDTDRQRRPVTPALTRVRRHCSTEWALRGVSFSVRAGESVAVVGHNGAGKTTLMRAIAGVLTPDEGHVEVRGRIGSLLSVDAGLMPPLTGRENSVMLGVLAGIDRAEVRTALASIQARSGLTSAFDRPVSTYSQGMRARLGFAVIEYANPEILLLDEVHEATDALFREELEAYAHRIRRRGGIVMAVGHDHLALSKLCERAMVLEPGGIQAVGFLDSTGSISVSAKGL